jgi:uncharacterized protein (TIGR00297 family)
LTWLIGALLAGLVATLSYRFRFLSLDGAIGAFVIGWIIFSFGRLTFSLPILTFFVLSSLLSKLGSTRKIDLAARFQKSNQRDLGQVVANGLIPAFLLVIWFISRDSIWFLLYLTSLASAAADTWATEIGVLSHSRPRSIINFKQVPAGTSGGVSALGLAAAFAGALTIALTGLLAFLLEPKVFFEWPLIFLLMIIGVLAQVLDSFLGASIQGQYRCLKCGKSTEREIHCSSFTTERLSGYRWVTNDVVNFSSNLCGVFLGWFIFRVMS